MGKLGVSGESTRPGPRPWGKKVAPRCSGISPRVRAPAYVPQRHMLWLTFHKHITLRHIFNEILGNRKLFEHIRMRLVSRPGQILASADMIISLKLVHSEIFHELLNFPIHADILMSRCVISGWPQFVKFA